MDKVKWTDWLAAIALVMALGAFAAAEATDEPAVTRPLTR